MVNSNLGPLPAGPVRTIEREELRRELAAGRPVKLVMSLSEWAFREKRIPGSLHFHTPEEMLSTLGKDDEIVVYCSEPSCIASLAAYRRLLDHGYTNVRRYAGGLSDWEAAGLPLEGEKSPHAQPER